MATYTPNLNLKKPSGTDRVLVSDLNDNFDKLDSAYAGGGGQGGGTLKILDTYDTYEQLKNSVTNPSVGDIYQVGTSAPYTLYLWNNGQWVNIGGIRGENAYVWIKYASDYPDSDDDMHNSPDQYMGIYSGNSESPPANYGAYTWYKIRGEQGVASYVHIRYSDNLPTKNIDMKDSISDWMGVLVDTTKQPSGVYTDYQWFKIKGEGISKVTFDSESYTLTIHLTDGTDYTTDSIRGETGNGIASIELQDDYTLKITDTDGNSYTTESIRGETGATPDIEFKAKTGKAGTDVQIEQSGTPEQPIVELTIPRGDQGKSYTILGHAYKSLEELQSDILAPEIGDQYNVGAEPPYNIYRWTGTEWEDQGTIGSVSEFTVNGKVLDGQNRNIEISANDIPMSDSDKTTVSEKIDGLTASDVGARPGTWMPTAADVGALEMDGTAADSEKLDGMTRGEIEHDTVSRARLYNLLDNSNFRNFISQANVGANHGTQAYAGDRWILDSGTVTGVADSKDIFCYHNIELNGNIRQIIPDGPEEASAFVKMISGEATARYQNGEFTIVGSGVLDWAMLLPGTVSNPPDYIPKGTPEEYLACMRYALFVPAYTELTIAITYNPQDLAEFFIPTPIPMKSAPTISPAPNLVKPGGGSAPTAATVSFVQQSPEGLRVRLASSGNGLNGIGYAKLNGGTLISCEP